MEGLPTTVKIGLFRRIGPGASNAVLLNGKELKPAASQKIRNHSPNGFEWGYPGSGPAQLALAICLELYGEEIARLVYQHFKEVFVAGWSTNAGILWETELDLTVFNEKYVAKLQEA